MQGCHLYHCTSVSCLLLLIEELVAKVDAEMRKNECEFQK